MTTIDQLAEARTAVINGVALYLAFSGPEFAREFLNFWDDTLMRDITVLAPIDRSIFIWRLIDQTMIRVLEIERTASRGSASLH
jgi:hypothetical protein